MTLVASRSVLAVIAFFFRRVASFRLVPGFHIVWISPNWKHAPPLEGDMRIRARGSLASFVLLGMCLLLAGCGTKSVCNANSLGCGCGMPGSAACPADFFPLLYATTTSSQVLTFSINTSTGSLDPARACQRSGEFAKHCRHR